MVDWFHATVIFEMFKAVSWTGKLLVNCALEKRSVGQLVPFRSMIE